MTLVLVASGSGGHLVPALALAEHLDTSAQCWILSTRRPVEERLAGACAQRWVMVDLERVTPLWRWLVPGYFFRQVRMLEQVWGMLRRARPDVVVGFGGYLSAAAAVAARWLKIPAVIHEQNLLPGRANRWISTWAAAVAVSFPETKAHLKRGTRVETTGNPVRFRSRVPLEQARRAFGFDLERPVLLVMGGSQGSDAINRMAVGMWQEAPVAARRRVQLVHLAGLHRADEVKAAYRRFQVQAVVFDFLDRMGEALSASTLCISRAGATTIAELVAFSLPALLIPYPYAAGHQEANADWMQSAGGAVVLQEERLTPPTLWQHVESLLWDAQRLVRMRQALAAQSNGSASEKLSVLIQEVVSRAKSKI